MSVWADLAFQILGLSRYLPARPSLPDHVLLSWVEELGETELE